MPDSRRICDLHHSAWQRWILNPLAKPGIKPATSWFLVGFVSAEPQQELPQITIHMYLFLVVSLVICKDYFSVRANVSCVL